MMSRWDRHVYTIVTKGPSEHEKGARFIVLYMNLGVEFDDVFLG